MRMIFWSVLVLWSKVIILFCPSFCGQKLVKGSARWLVFDLQGAD